ncbi:Gfo/Idh/MocA family protein [Alteribacillus bidgolensis]|uniref:Predicted dehydrogenase n=1 Tax=Alteribacillus bidgolensis TaxID=930129 RepID=A0A1G8RB23_9BACI|nr:Gfo/Idh/MocA family oxidoreductase [Alteribacillus bidgolensis]SDJ14053.1 Predicted dehydrogenase [Alteribacillus bidgolensis]
MSNQTIRIGIVGGSVNNQWASRGHIPALQRLSEYKITAIGTTRMESAEKSARQLGATHAFADSNEMANHPDVDSVIVSVKVPGHYDPVMSALNAGKHVYCEWPLGLNTAQSIEMNKLAKAKKLHHAVGLQARQSPEVNFVKDLVAQGYVGQVLSCHMKVFTTAKGGTTNETYKYLLDNTNGASLLTINSGHAIDAMCYALGDFDELSATMANQYKQAKMQETGEIIDKTTDDQILINGTLKSGATASIHVQGGVSYRTGVSLEIFGNKGVLVLSKESTHAQLQFGDLKVEGAQLSIGGNSSLTELTIPNRYRWVPDTIPKGPVLNVAQAHRKFAYDIMEETFRIPNFEDGVKLHKLIDRIQKAADTGERQVL